MPKLFTRISATMAAAALMFTGLSGTASADPTATAPDDLTATVTKEMLATSATVRPDLTMTANADSTQITVTKEADDWAFGTAVITTPQGGDAYPEGRLFLAKYDAGQWNVSFDGTADFASLSRDATVLTDAERASFGPDEVTVLADNRTQMRLPYAVGATWRMTSGPHGWSGNHHPWSSLDFAGGDERVRAMRSGTAYTMCKGWIRIIHGGGFATDYYHLWDNINVNGASVAAGAYLGFTGTDITCGGGANGRHVHMGLRHNNAYTALHGSNLGKWVIMNGSYAYQGSALHGSKRVYAGGSMYNYGALGLTQGVVDGNGTSSLNKRSGPGTGYGVVGSVADGATVTISCSANGTTHTGRWGSTRLWNRLSDGTWVADAYLWTGSNGPARGWC
ncbi:MAG TPA: hypothetical protein H9881_14370 [Candidatus Stackebrandtia excrementipullorum]|nr:hypothetical protein [Candidatus Stackebrandtia excrementipullorum]